MEPVMITQFPAMVSAKVRTFTCVILATNAIVIGIIVTTENIARTPQMKVEHAQPGMYTFKGGCFYRGYFYRGRKYSRAICGTMSQMKVEHAQPGMYNFRGGGFRGGSFRVGIFKGVQTQ